MRHPARITRRALLRGTASSVAASAVLAVLAACGGGSDDTSAAGASAGSSAAAAFPVSIKHKYGTTEITKAPSRVVVVGLTEQDALLSLGVVPVATTKWFGENPGEIWPWAKDKLGSGTVPQVLTNTDGIQYEKVAALKPDLIVGMYSNVSQKDYDTLSKIAPTIAQPEGALDFGVQWDTITTTLGQAVGKPAEATKLVGDTKALLAKVGTDNPSFAGRSGLMATTYQGYFVFGPTDPRNSLLESFGFTLPADLAKVTGDEFGKNISKEQTELLDVDTLVWLVTDLEKDRATVQKDPLYAALDVKKDGRDVFIADGSTLGSATSFISVLSLPYIIENLVPQLAAANDGNPATTATPAA